MLLCLKFFVSIFSPVKDDTNRVSSSLLSTDSNIEEYAGKGTTPVFKGIFALLYKLLLLFKASFLTKSV